MSLTHFSSFFWVLCLLYFMYSCGARLRWPCAGRKLKCDGQIPTCSNCSKRRLACQYAPYPKRRGPGKAPKGQRKQQSHKSAGPSSSGYTSATSEQDVRPQARPADDSAHVATHESTPAPAPVRAGPAGITAVPSSYVAAPSPRVALPPASGLGVYPAYPAHPSLFSMAEGALDLQLPPIQPSVPAHEPRPPPAGAYPHHAPYTAVPAGITAVPAGRAHAHAHGGGQGAPGDLRMRELWRSTSQASVATTASAPREGEGSHDEGSSPELHDATLRHEEPRRGGDAHGQGQGHASAPPPHAPSRREPYR